MIVTRSGATGVAWGNSPSTPHKGHFCKSAKDDKKKLGVWGVTSPIIFEFQPGGFPRPDLTYIFIRFLTNFILIIEFIFCLLKELCDDIGFMCHKVVIMK